MRIASLLIVPALLTTTLAAQEFSKSQRAELRQIIREEIRAAMQQSPATNNQTSRATTTTRTTTMRMPTVVTECPALSGKKVSGKKVSGKKVSGKKVSSKRNISKTNKQGSFTWSTVAPGVEVHDIHLGEHSSGGQQPKAGMFVFEDDGSNGAIQLMIEGDSVVHLPTIKKGHLEEILKLVHDEHAKKGKSAKGKADKSKQVRSILRSKDGETIEIFELNGHDAIKILNPKQLQTRLDARLQSKEIDLKKLELDLAKLESKLARVIELSPETTIRVECEECCEEECEEEEECCEECESEECCENESKPETIEIEIEFTTEPRKQQKRQVQVKKIKKVENMRQLMR